MAEWFSAPPTSLPIESTVPATTEPVPTTEPPPPVYGLGEDWYVGSPWVAGAVCACCLVIVRYLLPDRNRT